jgi:DNA repair photolyase
MTHSLFAEEAAPCSCQGAMVLPEEAKSILRPQKDDRYGFGISLNPYRGCAHSCKYCFVRRYPNKAFGVGDWGSWCAPKLNAPELLWKQRHRLHNQTVFMSSATDPYQPLEKEYRLARGCLKVLLECPSSAVTVYTRSSMVLQDIGLLKEFGPRLQVGISIPTDDDTVRQIIEPLASPIPTRWTTAERLAAAGIIVSIAATPIFPMHDMEAFLRRCRDCGAMGAWAGRIRLIKNDPFYALLKKHGWTRILEKGYGVELKAGLKETFPQTCQEECGDGAGQPAEEVCPRAAEMHPPLF